MTGIEKVIKLLRAISDDISGISIIFNDDRIKESKQQDLRILVNEVSDMLIKVDELLMNTNIEDIKDNIDKLNEEFKILVDATSVMLASYADSKHSITYESEYKRLLKEITKLEENKLELEKRTGIHIYKIKPTLEKGRRLIVENLQTFLRDLEKLIS